MGSQVPGKRPRHEHLQFRTTCNRQVTVGWLVLAGPGQPARRVSLDIGQSPGRQDGTWAALTPAEARQLATALLQQAAAAERASGR